VHPDEDGVDAAAVKAPRAGFDADVYRILARHLKGVRKGLRPWPPAA
jgi:hypothetical protein